MSKFYIALQNLYDEELKRISKQTFISIEKLQFLLKQSKLSPEDIDEACTAELLRICKLQYDDATTDRGHGWSSTKIKDHMNRFLREKLKMMSQVLRSETVIQEPKQNFEEYTNQLKERNMLYLDI